ncbi:alpha/beta hydrolase fold [Algibacter lectus]|uniref:alpha/beta hydrolase n=1 Tax=Algibacter lectus TaxID=221126 RepID=UPI0008E8C565|nr:alpha/beta hydrolase [Algibacter lectus]SFB94710.1 alpha/beta hydrolase fold [Algibacter lectus]
MKSLKTINIIVLFLIASHCAHTQKGKPAPYLTNVKYGEHERNVLDVWFADKNKTTPLAIFIHGGGFSSGNKERINGDELTQLLEAGISVASINYRYKSIAPLPAAHNDAKLALQFIRSNATEWNIDKNSIGVFGSSAGAQICMWLAFSDEMANTKSDDPIKRESTRVACLATKGGQTTMESDFWIKHIGKYAPGEEATFNGKTRLQTFGAKTLEEADEIAKTVSALVLVTADDPPIFMQYAMSPKTAVPNNAKRARGWVVHHVDFGTALKEKMDELNVEADLKYLGAKTKYNSFIEFFVDKLLDK